MSTDETWTLGDSINGHTFKHGQQWHRKDFTREMLSKPGSRPAILGEREEKPMEIFWPEKGEWAGYWWDDGRKVGADWNRRRTTRPLPDHSPEGGKMVDGKGLENSKLGEQLPEKLPENREARDGKWIDKFGCCKLCDGEIPHGHTNSCDLYAIEQERDQLKAMAEKAREQCGKLEDANHALFLELEEWKARVEGLREAIEATVEWNQAGMPPDVQITHIKGTLRQALAASTHYTLHNRLFGDFPKLQP